MREHGIILLVFLLFSLSFPTIYFNIGCPQLYDIITTNCAAFARLLRRTKPAGGFRKRSRHFSYLAHARSREAQDAITGGIYVHTYAARGTWVRGLIKA